MNTTAIEATELRYHDGFNSGESENRTLQGYRLAFTDGRWLCQGMPAKDTEYFAIDCKRVIQRWHDQTIMEEIFEPLPDVTKLNQGIPKSEWEPGLDGSPKPPFQENRVICLLDPQTAEKFTVISSSIGLRIAYEQLIDSVQTMRKLRGAPVVPVVQLACAPMKTRFGLKTRPHLAIVRWVNFGPAGIATNELPKLTGPSVKEPSASELISDDLPF
jgi:hypothetical protein